MAEHRPSESPADAAGGEIGTRVAKTFDVLGNKTRLAILLALWDAYDPHGTDDAVRFTELRDQIGIRQGAQFNYHLTKLMDHFVTKDDSGYRLTPIGRKFVQTIIADTMDESNLEPTEIAVPCHICDGTTAIAYQGGYLYHLCLQCDGRLGPGSVFDEGRLFIEPFPSSALSTRPPRELFTDGVITLLLIKVMKLVGLCPRCSGEIEASVHLCRDHHPGEMSVCQACGVREEVRVRWGCSVCKYRGGTSPAEAIITHPTVVSFYHDHGIDINYKFRDFETARRLRELMMSHEQVIVQDDPLQVEVTVKIADEVMTLMVDEELTVREVTRG